LIVSASADEVELGVSENGQTLEHIQLACTLGIEQIIVAVNKMDATEPSYSEKRFDQIRAKIFNYIQQIGYHPLTIVFIPILGWYGDKIVNCALSNLSIPVKSIEMSMSGNYVGFSVQDIRREQLERGFICSDIKNDPTQEVTSFIANV
jgi:translation elongation factor EF-1alpha